MRAHRKIRQGDADMRRFSRRAFGVAFRTLKNHRPNQMLLRVDCKAPHGTADYPQQKP